MQAPVAPWKFSCFLREQSVSHKVERKRCKKELLRSVMFLCFVCARVGCAYCVREGVKFVRAFNLHG